MGFDFSIDAILAPTSKSYEEEEVDIEGFDGEEADEQMARNSVQSDDSASDGDSSSSSSTTPSSSIGSQNNALPYNSSPAVRMSIRSSNSTSNGDSPSSSLSSSPSSIGSLNDSPDQKSSLGRPIFTYPSLIYLAIINSPNKMLLLSEICGWIRKHFQYYREENIDFTSSIRHNLTMKDIFQRSPRYLNDPGRGSYWIIDPNCIDVTICENTGRLRYTKIADPMRSKTNKLVHQNTTQMYPFSITRHVMPTAIYFPTPGEQMQMVHNHQHLNSTWNNWAEHIQSMYSQPRNYATQNG